MTCPPPWPQRSSTRGGSRSAARTAIADLEAWLGAQSGVGVVAACSTTRGRDAARRSRWPSPGQDGRVVAADGPEAADALRRLLERPAHPARRSRGQAAARRRLRRRPGVGPAAGRVRHPDRRLHPQRGPAQPDDRRRRGREPRPDPAAGQRAARRRPGPGSRRSPPSRSGSRSSAASTTSIGSPGCTARSSCR